MEIENGATAEIQVAEAQASHQAFRDEAGSFARLATAPAGSGAAGEAAPKRGTLMRRAFTDGEGAAASPGTGGTATGRKSVRWLPGMKGGLSPTPVKEPEGNGEGASTPMTAYKTPAAATPPTRKSSRWRKKRRGAIKIDPAGEPDSPEVLEDSQYESSLAADSLDLSQRDLAAATSSVDIDRRYLSTEVPGAPTAAPVHIPTLPGGVSAPVKAWVRARSITFGFFQLPPYSPRFRIFSKRSGVMFGTEVDADAERLVVSDKFVPAQPAGIPRDELLRRQDARYLEYTLEGLRPNSRYTIKITGSGQKQTVKGYLLTISDTEQYKRDTVMSRFAGVVVMVGGRDCIVSKFDAASGLFTLQPIEADEVLPPLQLRFRSDYSAEGHPAQTFTLSTIHFSRWGGEMRSSATLSAGEMQERAARAADSQATTRAEREFDLKAQLLNREVKDFKHKMSEERRAVAREKVILSRVLLAVLAVVLLISAAGLVWLWLDSSAAARQHKAVVASLSKQLAAERRAQAAANCTLAPLDLNPDAEAALSEAAAALSRNQAQQRPSWLGRFPSIRGPSRAPPPGMPREAADWPDPAGGGPNEDVAGRLHQQRQRSGFGFGGGDGLEEQLHTLTDLYQNQILLRMQKAMEQAGIAPGSRNGAPEGEL